MSGRFNSFINLRIVIRCHSLELAVFHLISVTVDQALIGLIGLIEPTLVFFFFFWYTVFLLLLSGASCFSSRRNGSGLLIGSWPISSYVSFGSDGWGLTKRDVFDLESVNYCWLKQGWITGVSSRLPAWVYGLDSSCFKQVFISRRASSSRQLIFLNFLFKK